MYKEGHIIKDNLNFFELFQGKLLTSYSFITKNLSICPENKDILLYNHRIIIKIIFNTDINTII